MMIIMTLILPSMRNHHFSVRWTYAAIGLILIPGVEVRGASDMSDSAALAACVSARPSNPSWLVRLAASIRCRSN
jgi:hypothetical protein